jgi:hypothetical protein
MAPLVLCLRKGARGLVCDKTIKLEFSLSHRGM